MEGVNEVRQTFFQELYKRMRQNVDIVALTGDLGFGGFDPIQKDLPSQFVNCGAAEQAMLGMACGLSLKGKIPVVYSITPFLIYRGFETLRTYIDHEKIKVILIGSGRDKDYAHDGFSHDATDIPRILSTLSNVVQCYPESKEEIPTILDEMISASAPSFLSLRR